MALAYGEKYGITVFVNEGYLLKCRTIIEHEVEAQMPWCHNSHVFHVSHGSAKKSRVSSTEL